MAESFEIVAQHVRDCLTGARNLGASIHAARRGIAAASEVVDRAQRARDWANWVKLLDVEIDERASIHPARRGIAAASEGADRAQRASDWAKLLDVEMDELIRSIDAARRALAPYIDELVAASPDVVEFGGVTGACAYLAALFYSEDVLRGLYAEVRRRPRELVPPVALVDGEPTLDLTGDEILASGVDCPGFPDESKLHARLIREAAAIKRRCVQAVTEPKRADVRIVDGVLQVGGRSYPRVEGHALSFFEHLLDAGASGMTASAFSKLGMRPDRVYAGLAPELRELIDKPGRGQKGYRLR